MTATDGAWNVPREGVIAIADASLAEAGRMIQALLPGHALAAAVAGTTDSVTVTLDAALAEEGYRLAIGPEGVTVTAGAPIGAIQAARTLAQIAEQAGGAWPGVEIEDQPDFRYRGLYYDVCRGRVPKLEQLKAQIAELASYKINEYQLYIEHTFAFRRHPDIGKDASPLSADDILELDAWCRQHHVELVPSLASFGHLSTVLKHPQYHYLAEDCGAADYKGWTLSPAEPRIYDFLDELFAEFLPLFSSTRFNVCCDETWDLGAGRSREMCERLGKGRVYLGHIIKLNEICRRHGKSILFWGDIIRHYPELIPDIPKDVTVLDWAYNHNHDFEAIRDFEAAGLPFYACPGTSSWVSLFPRLHEALANIHGFAAAGHAHGAMGLLNTDWGDGGHYNFMEYSWHGYLAGAEQAWNTRADLGSFTGRFCRRFLKAAAPELVEAITAFGDVVHLHSTRHYQSVWRHVLFAAPDDPVFTRDLTFDWMAKGGEIKPATLSWDADFGRATVARLEAIRKVFAKAARQRGADPLGVLPYWIFAVDTHLCAARKLAAFGEGGTDSKADRQALRIELKALRARFQELWHARNRPSEIEITLGYYAQALRSIKRRRKVRAYVSAFIGQWQISRVFPGLTVDAATLQTPADDLGWEPIASSATIPGFVNVHERYPESAGAVYLTTTVSIERGGGWKLLLGHDGGARVWLDDQVVLTQPARSNPALPDRSAMSVRLTPGEHRLTVAFDLGDGLGWGIYARWQATARQAAAGVLFPATP